MKYNLILAAVLLPLVAACGGGGGSTSSNGNGNGNGNGDGDGNGNGDGVGNADTCCLQDSRDRPASGTVRTSSISGASIVSNGSTGDAGAGPVVNNNATPNNFPRLAVGDYLWVNNAFDFSNTRYADWFQSIELIGTNGSLIPIVRYDWGAEADLSRPFSTVSFPDLRNQISWRAIRQLRGHGPAHRKQQTACPD